MADCQKESCVLNLHNEPTEPATILFTCFMCSTILHISRGPRDLFIYVQDSIRIIGFLFVYNLDARYETLTR